MDQNKGIIFVLISALLWGFSPIFIKLVVDTISPVFITFVRYGIASIIMLPFIFINKKEVLKLNKKDVGLVLLLGIIGTSIAATAFQASIEYIGAAVSMFILRMEPIFVAVLVLVFLKETITKRIAASIALAFLGSLLVSFQSVPVLSFTNMLLIGFLLAISAAILWAFATILGKQLVNKLSPINLVALRSVIAFLFISVFVYGSINESIAIMTYSDWIFLLLLGIFSTSVAYICFYKGLKVLSASKTVIITLLSPIVTLIFSYIIMGEIFTIMQLIGGFLILYAIYNVSKK